MFRCLLTLACLLGLASPLFAQAFGTPVRFDVSAVTQGQAFELRLVEGDRTKVAEEALIYLPDFNVITVGRMHPTKKGINGLFLGAGFCAEMWTSLPARPGEWNFFTDGDITGDGLTDFFIYWQDGTGLLLPGRGLLHCR